MVYSEEEIKVLRDILKWRLGTDNFMHRATLTVHETTLVLQAHELEDRINGYTHPIWGFLHSTPLEEVPLYVNTMPELARWRLMIAK